MYLCTVLWNNEKKYYHLCDMNHKEIQKLTSIFDELRESQVVKHYFFDKSIGMPSRLSSRILRENWINSNLLEDIARNYFNLDLYYKYSENYFEKKNKSFRDVYSISSKNADNNTNEITDLDIIFTRKVIEDDEPEDDEPENNESENDEDEKSDADSGTDDDGNEYQDNIETDSIDSDDEGDPSGKPCQSDNNQ